MQDDGGMTLQRTEITASLSYTIKDHSAKVAAEEIAKLEGAIVKMADSIKGLAILKAPELTGNLKRSGRIEQTAKNEIAVVFGNGKPAKAGGVPYARRRHYENNKNPQTKYYLQDAGDETIKKGIESFL